MYEDEPSVATMMLLSNTTAGYKKIIPSIFTSCKVCYQLKNALRFFYADALRALAMFAVIILHNAADYDEQLGEIPKSYWWAGDVWNGLVRFCVPMFVLLSGALLLKAGKVVPAREVF